MIVRRLFSLLATLVLGAGLLLGSLVHATQVAGSPVPTTATAWLHPDGDADQVAADNDKTVPHHHNGCDGHDLAASLSVPDTSCPGFSPTARIAGPASPLGDASPLLALRPPIA